jgi:hypothetical protein
MCPATIGTSSICQTNMLNKIATMTGQTIYNYTKAGVVPVEDLSPLLTPKPENRHLILIGGMDTNCQYEDKSLCYVVRVPTEHLTAWTNIPGYSSVTYLSFTTSADITGYNANSKMLDKENVDCIGYSAGAETCLAFLRQRWVSNKNVDHIVTLGPTFSINSGGTTYGPEHWKQRIKDGYEAGTKIFVVYDNVVTPLIIGTNDGTMESINLDVSHYCYETEQTICYRPSNYGITIDEKVLDMSLTVKEMVLNWINTNPVVR